MVQSNGKDLLMISEAYSMMQMMGEGITLDKAKKGAKLGSKIAKKSGKILRAITKMPNNTLARKKALGSLKNALKYGGVAAAGAAVPTAIGNVDDEEDTGIENVPQVQSGDEDENAVDTNAQAVQCDDDDESVEVGDDGAKQLETLNQQEALLKRRIAVATKKVAAMNAQLKAVQAGIQRLSSAKANVAQQPQQSQQQQQAASQPSVGDKAASAVGDVVGGVADGAGNIVKGLGNGIGSVVGGVANGLGSVVGGLGKAFGFGS